VIRELELARLFAALAPEAKRALRVLAEAQKRPVEDVLRDEVREYAAGRLPTFDIDAAMSRVKSGAYEAGKVVGQLRSLARRFSEKND